MEYRRKKCFLQKLFIIVALLFVPLFSVLKSDSTSAVGLDYSYFRLYYRSINSWDEQVSGQINYFPDSLLTGVHSIRVINSAIGSVSVPSGSNYFSITSKYNLVVFTDTDYAGYLPVVSTRDIGIRAVTINGNDYAFESSNIDVYTTTWNCSVYDVSHLCRTFTFNVSFIVKNIPSTINSIVYGIGNATDSIMNTGYVDGMYVLFEHDNNNFANIEFAYDYATALSQQQVQLQQTIINQDNTYYNHEYQAESNISNQSSSDIPDSSNSQTTTIIGTIQSFASALSTVQTGSCTMTLPFPSFIGGDQTVNPCNGKDKAPTLITIGSSMFLIGIFVPFAFIVLKMIYGEIRSWTNG